MKLVFKTALLTFTASFLLFIVPMFQDDKHYNVVAFPVSLSDEFQKKQLSVIPINEYKFTDKQKKQINCLATNMYHESKGEGGHGWLAVGMVTMNRVDSKRYPNTICEVVYQNNGKVYQFSWAGTKKKLTIPKEELYNEIHELALLIYIHHEKMYDVTDEALFFHADYVDPYWNKKLIKTTKIGRHIFYKL